MPTGVPQLVIWPLSSISANQEGFQRVSRLLESQDTNFSLNSWIANVEDE